MSKQSETPSPLAGHTPLPWRCVPNPMRDDGVFVCYGPDRVYQESGSPQLPKGIGMGQVSPADGALIVEAVNSHATLLRQRDALAKALSWALAQLPPASSDDSQSYHWGLDSARAALSSIGGPQA